MTPILKVSESYLRGTPGTSKNFPTEETLNTIEESSGARLECKTGQYLDLKLESAQVHGVCDAVESHLWSTDSRFNESPQGVRLVEPKCSLENMAPAVKP